jgi:hypothetical protein
METAAGKSRPRRALLERDREKMIMNRFELKALGMLSAAILAGAEAQAQTPAALFYDSTVRPISFAASDLKAALQRNGYSVSDLPPGDPSTATQSVRIILTTQTAPVPGMPASAGLTEQGYLIQRVAQGSATNWWVIGRDPAGAMYGGLELAEAVTLADGLAGVTNRQTNPYLTSRGVKINIPLDVRTPSYSDNSSSAQANIAHMWETNFWTGLFDNLARDRFNTLSLWTLHPFPSLVRVPEYPNVALADVKKKSGALWSASGMGPGMYNPTWTLTTLKTMTMDEKIAFWRWVMQYARDRGVNLYFITWNIFVFGTEPSGYGITDSPSNATTKDYFRRSVRTLFNTYPLLAGIGITAGENMGGITDAQEEQWLWDTYGLGISDAMADAQNPASPYHAPGRVIRLIHRAHMADLNQIVSYFQGLPGYTNTDSTLSFSFKYSQAHMHSSIAPQYIFQNGWFDTIPSGKKTWLTVRNDDLYYMRWGGPDFARSYFTNFPDRSKIAGFYMGADGYTWGREYVSTEPDSPHALVYEKMWYSMRLYGRLAYDPTIPNSRFEAILAERFPEVPGGDLFQGWASVSKILPLITRFYWGALDYQWYPEACRSSSGFETVQNFIDPKNNPMQDWQDGERPLLMDIKEYVGGVAANGRLHPEQVADRLQQYADEGLLRVQALNPGTNKELRLTLGDIQMMAWLGRYYADKIRGAVDLYRYQVSDLAGDHANARAHLINASNDWSQYSLRWSTQYVQQVLTRMFSTTPVNILSLQSQVNADIPAPLNIPTNGPGTNTVLFVVGDAASLGAADVGVRNRLQNHGYGVQVVSDELSTTTDASGKVLVLTSATVSSSNVGAKFRDVAVPVINWEYALEDDYRFTANADTDRGLAATQTNLVITAPAHPLAGGLPAGTRAVATVAGDFCWGAPGGNPIVVATLADGSGQPCIYGYEANAAMIGGNAPARRVQLFVQGETFSSLNGDGVKLFDAALKWAMNRTSLAEPSVSLTQPTNGAVFDPGTNLPITASASDPGGSVARVEYFIAGATKIGESTNGPAFGFIWTNAPAGQHSLTAKATDNDGATGTSSAVSLTVRTRFQPPSLEGETISVRWVGGGTLQTATNVLGPWTNVPGVGSPFSADTSNSAQFFRVKQ